MFRRERSYISKLNTILVAVLKQEWPARWPTFIADLVAAAKSAETLCENCMHILKARRRLAMRAKSRPAVMPALLVLTRARAASRTPRPQLLSEEVFDFSRGEMTQAKIKELKHSLNKCVSRRGCACCCARARAPSAAATPAPCRAAQRCVRRPQRDARVG